MYERYSDKDDPLGPARGIMWGIVLGFCLYVVAALIGWGIVALTRDDEPVRDPRCAFIGVIHVEDGVAEDRCR